MKMILLLLSFILIASCSHNSVDVKNGLIIFEQGMSYPVKHLKISDIADVNFIKLNTPDSILLYHPGAIKGTYIDENNIIISDCPMDESSFVVYRFDNFGNYMNRISRYGRGPGEVSQRAKIFYEGDSTLFLYSGFDSKLTAVNINGDFIRTYYITQGHTELEIMDDEVLIYDQLSQYESNKRMTYRGEPLRVFYLSQSEPVIRLSEPTDILLSNEHASYIDCDKMIKSSPVFTRNKDGVYMSSLRFDTIYHINNNLHITPKIVVKKTLQSDEYYTILPLIETDKYLIFKEDPDRYSSLKCAHSHYIFIKAENKIYRIHNNLNPGTMKFLDFKRLVLDDEICISPNFLTLNSNVLAIYFTSEEINELYEYLTPELKTLSNNITDNDNPLLMVITFH